MSGPNLDRGISRPMKLAAAEDMPKESVEAHARRVTRFAGFDPAWLLWLLAVAVLALLVLNPLLRLVIASFQATETGELTLANYPLAYSPRGIWALLNSLLYSGAVTAVAALLALPIAWA